jgi:ribosomal protein S12 methylthiotransferase
MTAHVERNLKRAAPPPRVGFVSLGCPKALVDSEQILTQLRAEGYAISPTYDGADLVVVNTCGFIDAAIGDRSMRSARRWRRAAGDRHRLSRRETGRRFRPRGASEVLAVTGLHNGK